MPKLEWVVLDQFSSHLSKWQNRHRKCPQKDYRNTQYTPSPPPPPPPALLNFETSIENENYLFVWRDVFRNKFEEVTVSWNQTSEHILSGNNIVTNFLFKFICSFEFKICLNKYANSKLFNGSMQVDFFLSAAGKFCSLECHRPHVSEESVCIDCCKTFDLGTAAWYQRVRQSRSPAIIFKIRFLLPGIKLHKRLLNLELQQRNSVRLCERLLISSSKIEESTCKGIWDNWYLTVQHSPSGMLPWNTIGTRVNNYWFSSKLLRKKKLKIQ